MSSQVCPPTKIRSRLQRSCCPLFDLILLLFDDVSAGAWLFQSQFSWRVLGSSHCPEAAWRESVWLAGHGRRPPGCLCAPSVRSWPDFASSRAPPTHLQHHLKSVKFNGNQWKSMEIHENQRNCLTFPPNSSMFWWFWKLMKKFQTKTCKCFLNQRSIPFDCATKSGNRIRIQKVTCICQRCIHHWQDPIYRILGPL